MEWVERRVGKVEEVVVEHVEQGPNEESQPVASMEFKKHHDEDPLEIVPCSCCWPWWSLQSKIANKIGEPHCLKVQGMNTAFNGQVQVQIDKKAVKQATDF